jgi:signal peptidase II
LSRSREKKEPRDGSLFLGVAFSIFVLDQLTKLLSKGVDITLLPFFRLSYLQNSGAGFSILRGQQVLLSIISIVAVGLIIYYYPKIKDKVVRIACALLLGGALGNLYDRVLLGYVRDFISISIFPTFNLADTAITVAIILLAIRIKD